MNLFMFAASLRKDSVNKKLIKLASTLIDNKHTINLVDYNEFHAPIYNADVETSSGIPENIKKFITHLKQSDGLIISSPEYNFSTPGTLKNLIDWVSRDNPMPWREQKILLLSASPALAGGVRGLWQTRIPLEGCGAHVFPDMFSLSSAYSAFAENGELLDKALQERLKNNLHDFIKFAELFRA